MRIKIYQINSKRDIYQVRHKNLQATQYLQRMQGQSALIDPAIYDEVFSGEVNCKDLEELRDLYNTKPPAFHRGRYLSVSDIVQVLDAPELVGRIQFYHEDGQSEEIDYVNSDKYNHAIFDAHEAGQNIQTFRLAGHHVPSVEHGFYFCDPKSFEKINFNPKLTHKLDDLLRVVAVEPDGLVYETEIANTMEAMRKAVEGNLRVSAPFEDENVALVSRELNLFNIKNGSRYKGDDLFNDPLFIVGDDGDGNFSSLTDEQVRQYLAVFKQPEHSEREDMDEDMGENMDTGINMS